MIRMRTTCLNRWTSNTCWASENFVRLMDARLQALLSTNMYSEQGLLALIRPLAGQVCQRLMVVSYCNPGSPQKWAASAALCITVRASSTSTMSPVVTACVCQTVPASTAFINSSETRTDRLAFWNMTEE